MAVLAADAPTEAVSASGPSPGKRGEHRLRPIFKADPCWN
ncbi:hypothetical protein GLA29479_2202 [Lysobacter antibioticus]|nr:hypothetical protein GLA29479_2202 [Lysobacter antibioticus]